MTPFRDTLLAEIASFMTRTGMSETALGKRAVREPNILRRLRAGRSVSIDTADRIRAFMASWQPPASQGPSARQPGGKNPAAKSKPENASEAA